MDATLRVRRPGCSQRGLSAATKVAHLYNPRGVTRISGIVVQGDPPLLWQRNVGKPPEDPQESQNLWKPVRGGDPSAMSY